MRVEHTYTCQSVRVPVFKFSTNASLPLSGLMQPAGRGIEGGSG